jgi:hypothetical protein
MKLTIDIADAVAAELNAAEPGTFSEDLTAQRRVLPKFELADLADLKVSVVPKGIEIENASREDRRCDISVDIGVQQKVGKDVDAEVERLCELVEQIADYLAARGLSAAGMSGVAFVSLANEPVYSTEHLADDLAFTSVLTVTYRTLK